MGTLLFIQVFKPDKAVLVFCCELFREIHDGYRQQI